MYGHDLVSTSYVFETPSQASRFMSAISSTNLKCLRASVEFTKNGTKGNEVSAGSNRLPQLVEHLADAQVHVRVVTVSESKWVADWYFESIYLQQGRTVGELVYSSLNQADHSGSVHFASIVANRIKSHAR